MLSAVILVLREVLEAAFIIALLIALSRRSQLARSWCFLAVALGFVMSGLLAHFAYEIADAMDGIGQELFNSFLYIFVIACINLLNILILPWLFSPLKNDAWGSDATTRSSFIYRHKILLYLLLILIVSCVIAREGAEVWIYLSSFVGPRDNALPALLGGAIGAGIGISVGALAYYLFVFMPGKSFLSMFLLAMTLIIGGLALQVAKELMQIGWLESAQPLWDSSFLIAEHSLTGELFYALIGYEAKPTPIQGIFYLLAIVPTLAFGFWQWLSSMRRQYV